MSVGTAARNFATSTHFLPLQAAPGASGEVDPLVKFTEHGDVVEDVDWHRHHEHIFGSVGDDKHVYM